MKLPFTLPRFSFSSPLSLEAVIDYLATRSERERRMLLAGAIALVLILVFAIIVPLDRSVAHAKTRLTQKRADLAFMQGVAPEISNSSAPSSSSESLILIVDRSAREAGLQKSLAGSEPGGQNSLSVRLEKAPFDKLVTWLGRIAVQNGVVVDSATIEKTGAPGEVNAAIVLHSG
jgi:type II secretory pathway component PulM